MSGKRKFDTEIVDHQILNVFWRKGFSGTSIDDLVDATGLKRGSLYNAFGDKEQMFLRALDLYSDEVQASIVESLEHPALDDALDALFERMLAILTDPATPEGCLIANCVNQDSRRDDAIGEHVRKQMLQSDQIFEQRLKAALAAGEIAEKADIAALAQFLSGISYAIPTVYQATGDAARARNIGKTAINAVVCRNREN